jgi:hypothetical protein
LIYRARLLSPEVSAGLETEILDLFTWDRIPWDDIAFPSVHWALGHYRELRDQRVFAPRGNPPPGQGDPPAP